MAQGIITVSEAMFEGHDAPKQPQTLAEWHAFLMLPEEYHLLEAKKDAVYPYWKLTVEHKAIPMADVAPIYCVERNEENGTQTHYLDRIELVGYKPGYRVIWQRSKQ